MELVKLAARSELPACGQVKEFFAAGRAVCVVNVNGEIYAMDNICPHWGGPLGRGRLVDGKLRCPWHGWEFDPKSGQSLRKTNVNVPTYKVKCEGEDVFIELEICEQLRPCAHAVAAGADIRNGCDPADCPKLNVPN